MVNLLSLTFPYLRTRRRPPAPPLSLFDSSSGNRSKHKEKDARKPKSSDPGGQTLQNHECGPINIEAVQQIMAAKWAVDVINNQSKPDDLKIGK